MKRVMHIHYLYLFLDSVRGNTQQVIVFFAQRLCIQIIMISVAHLAQDTVHRVQFGQILEIAPMSFTRLI
jgi:hypothetical protein